jgi:hypothetical protein
MAAASTDGRIEDLIAQHRPWTTVVELARRWTCLEARLAGCGAVRDRAVTLRSSATLWRGFLFQARSDPGGLAIPATKAE